MIGLVLVGASAVAQEKASVTGADITEAGIYSAAVVQKTAEPGVASGTNEWLESFTLVRATTNVPARIGTRFGFRYTIRGTPSNAPVVLKMVGEHPPYKNPESGTTQTRDEYELKSWIGRTYTSYMFEQEWELVPGRFKFEVWHEGRKLCEQSFMVVADPEPKSEK